MLNLEYIKNAASLSFDPDLCTGCGMCLKVCPHAVFEFRRKDEAAVEKDCGCEGAGCSGGNGRSSANTAVLETVAVSKRRIVEIVYKDRCMECGACMMNCPTGAITVKKGVGCAAAVIASRLAGREDISCGCGEEEGCTEEGVAAGAVNTGCGCGDKPEDSGGRAKKKSSCCG
ncbi:MAG: 4Fe-4S dicluster domain-containing protein [Spirochaetales bacterium]|nr:MAG: 4Fe-4S dicluster domain-containing protein [Spirochaetales bacterium]